MESVLSFNIETWYVKNRTVSSVRTELGLARVVNTASKIIVGAEEKLLCDLFHLSAEKSPSILQEKTGTSS